MSRDQWTAVLLLVLIGFLVCAGLFAVASWLASPSAAQLADLFDRWLSSWVPGR